jgi:hypothetical protein
VNGLTWFWPVMILAVAVSALLGSTIAGVLRIGRPLATFLLVGIGLVVAATLTPVRAPLGVDLTVLRSCDLGRTLPTIAQLTTWSEVTLSLAAFLPAGVAIGLLPRSVRSGVVLLGIVALPVAVEVAHFLVPVLARACKSGNAIDGELGLAIGAVVGVAIRLGDGIRRRRRRAAPG